MLIGLDADFWVCLCWVAVSFLGFCFLYGFLTTMMATGAGGWDAVVSGGRAANEEQIVCEAPQKM